MPSSNRCWNAAASPINNEEHRLKHPKMMILAASFALAGMAHAALPASNPFAAPSKLPLQYPAFDKIHDADYAPAFE